MTRRIVARLRWGYQRRSVESDCDQLFPWLTGFAEVETVYTRVELSIDFTPTIRQMEVRLEQIRLAQTKTDKQVWVEDLIDI